MMSQKEAQSRKSQLGIPGGSLVIAVVHCGKFLIGAPGGFLVITVPHSGKPPLRVWLDS